MWVLIGVLLVIVGFALRINPLLVVTVSGIVTALIGGLNPMDILNIFGEGFAGSRSITTFVLVLPVIGLIERYGLQAQAGNLIGKLRRLTTGGILTIYLGIRQATAMLGLTSIAGPAQTVRPLVFPMAEAAHARRIGRNPSEKATERIKAFTASSDTVGLFFGEDAFVAIGSILLITSFVDTTYNLKLEPIQLALWAIPVAVMAFLVHGARLMLFDRQLIKLDPPGALPKAAGATAAAAAGAAEEAAK